MPDFSGHQLGARPPIAGRMAVSFQDFIIQVPEHPLASAIPDMTYPMDHNDRAGVCVIAGVDHAEQTIAALLEVPRANWTDDEQLTYYRTQNQRFRGWGDGGTDRDNGMVIQTFLEYLVARKQVLGFARIDHTNREMLRAATYIGLAIVTGETLQVAQQTQSEWDYSPSAEWGGHCTTFVSYDGDSLDLVTWGEKLPATDEFISRQVTEAWFILTQAHIEHPGFRDAFDLQGFSNAVAAMTQGKIIVPVPPHPNPAPPPPPPAPEPLTPEEEALVAALDKWDDGIKSAKTDAGKVAAAARAWARSRGVTSYSAALQEPDEPDDES